MMAGRVQVVQTGQTLRVVFSRIGQEPQVLIARDGEYAWAHAIGLISQHDELLAGDRVFVEESR